MNKEFMDVTTELSVVNFQKIATFILKKGDRRFYCNKYNNSPHYKLDSFEVYLDPVSQFVNWTKDDLSDNVLDYNTIVIHDRYDEIQYYRVMLKDAAVLLDCRDEKDKAHLRKLFLNTYLPLIEKEFNLNDAK